MVLLEKSEKFKLENKLIYYKFSRYNYSQKMFVLFVRNYDNNNVNNDGEVIS